MDHKIEKKKGLKPRTILLIVAGLAFVALIANILLNAGTSTFRADKDLLTLATVETGSFKDYVSIIGTVEPMSSIYIDGEEGGKVVEKVADEGEMVKAGDVIIRMVNNDLNLQILNTESQLAYQTNELRNTLIGMEQQKISNKEQLLNIDYELIRLQRNFEQNSDLYKKGFVSKEVYLLSKDNYELGKHNRELRYERMVQDSIFRENQKAQMNNSLKNMQQNLSMVRQRIENLNVKAPADGQLGSLDVEIGQTVGRGERIGQLHILDKFKVVAQIDEHYIDQVHRELKGTFERQDKQFDMDILKVYPEVREGRFQIDLQISGVIPDNLRTGQTYHIKLELGQPVDALLLARGTFFQNTGGQWAYVLNESGKTATKRTIRIGRQNPLYFEVLEGLKPGEQVIVSGYDGFGEAEKIELK
ncbi:MAG: HlyD family efflux transporter periplasmic adaptor subunit [Bacteroidales bacterium]|nr:HlyD family efflux transporter periplasmic adaptor subunit [Bacteroidales bacterium]